MSARKVEIELPDVARRDYQQPITARIFLALLLEGENGERFLDAPLSVLVQDGNLNNEVCPIQNDWPRRENDRVWLTAFTKDKRLVRRAGR